MIRKTVWAAACAVLVTPLWLSAAVAGPMGKACLRSDHPEATRAMCNCIERVADQTLRVSDQRRAAKFFNDPDKAHEVWVSQSKSDDAFWERYLRFGTAAEEYCAG